jgi:hypothetical protein
MKRWLNMGQLGKDKKQRIRFAAKRGWMPEGRVNRGSFGGAV